MDGALPSICKEKTCIFGSDRNLDPLKNDIWCMLCILKGERESRLQNIKVYEAQTFSFYLFLICINCTKYLTCI